MREARMRQKNPFRRQQYDVIQYYVNRLCAVLMFGFRIVYWWMMFIYW